MSQSKFILILFFLGATTGSFFDGFHTFSHTTAYPDPIFLKMAWWVPLLFGFAYVAIGVSHADFYHFFKPKDKFVGWEKVIVSFLCFGLVYFASAFLRIDNSLKTILLYSVALLVWLLFNGMWQGLVLGVIAGLVGSLFEITIIHYKAFYYVAPDLWGIPYWLPALYICGSVAGGNIARKLKSL